MKISIHLRLLEARIYDQAVIANGLSTQKIVLYPQYN